MDVVTPLVSSAAEVVSQLAPELPNSSEPGWAILLAATALAIFLTREAFSIVRGILERRDAAKTGADEQLSLTVLANKIDHVSKDIEGIRALLEQRREDVRSLYEKYSVLDRAGGAIDAELKDIKRRLDRLEDKGT